MRGSIFEGRTTNSLPIHRQSTSDTRHGPRLVLIADRFTDPARAERTVAAVRAGVRWVHLRDHQATRERFAEAARRLVRRLRAARPNVDVSVNTQLDVAASLGIHVHLGTRGPSVEAARQRLGRDRLVGYSAHALDEAQEERLAAADYFFFSPVYPTSSKPGHPGVGLAALAAFCEAARPRPVFALGGVTPARVADCRAAGAYGVAVLSGILTAESVEEATRVYLKSVGEWARGSAGE